METLPESPILIFRPDTLNAVRKVFNLDGPGRMKEAVDILDEWVKKQEHFVKKDFSRDYLEITIICSKGSIERAKKRIDKMCTLRTFVKGLFGNFDLKNDFKHIFGEKITQAILPNLTKDHCRVFVIRFHKVPDTKDMSDMYRIWLICFEYLRAHDYANGYITLCDYRDLNVLEFVSNVSLTELRKVTTTMVDGYGWRMKGVYYLSSSKFIDTGISIFKQVLSTKLGDRIHAINTLEKLYEHVPKEIMPKDYGGNEKSLAELHDDCLKELTSEEFTKYRKEMNKACTDESLRPVDTFNIEHMGMPGTFRSLSFD